MFDNLIQLEHLNIVKFHKYWADIKENKARVRTFSWAYLKQTSYIYCSFYIQKKVVLKQSWNQLVLRYCCLVTKLCPTLCNLMNCSTPGFPVLHYLQVFSDSCPLSQRCHPAISSSVTSFSWHQSFPASGSFPVSQLFASGGQSVGASASAPALPVNIQGWFPLGLTGFILHSKGMPMTITCAFCLVIVGANMSEFLFLPCHNSYCSVISLPY